MPDAFGLAALNEAMRFRIGQFLGRVDATQVGTVEVVSRAPELLSANPPDEATITVFPWRCEPNAGWQSSRDPAYGASGARRENPWLALDVTYLVCGYGPDGGVDRALGMALLALHETPRLAPEVLEAAANGTFDAGSPLPQALRDLADQPAPLKVSPVPMTTEEQSHLWSMMNAGLRPGMAFEVATLLMEHRAPRTTAPPVAEARLGVTLLRRPTISRMRFSPGPPVAPAWSDRPMAAPGDLVLLTGSGLRGDVTELAVGRRTLTPAADEVRDDRIEAALPGDLRPGVVAIQVRHRWPAPEGRIPPPATGTIAAESTNLLPAVVRPVLDTPAVTTGSPQVVDGVVHITATAHFAVPVGRAQQAELLLSARVADADGRFPSFTVESAPTAAGVPDAPVTTRTFTLIGVPPGEYLVRVRVDDAESALEADAGGHSGPVVEVPS